MKPCKNFDKIEKYPYNFKEDIIKKNYEWELKTPPDIYELIEDMGTYDEIIDAMGHLEYMERGYEGRLDESEETEVKYPCAEFEVECVNNAGIEDEFDVGVDYVAEPHEDDDSLLYVYSNHGLKRKLLRNRFHKKS